MSDTTEAGAHVLPRGVLVAFTLPTLVLGIMHGPEGQIQAIYAKHAGIALTAIAAATLLSKILDAVTYPLIGHLSDQTFARRGSRKSWILAGTVLSAVAVWKLLRPPEHADVIYFGLWMTGTYFGWKLTEIPLQAWSYGLSEDYAQRSRVQSWRLLAQILGQLLFFSLPFIAMKAGQSNSTELDFQSLGFSAVACAFALPLATLCAVIWVPNGTAPPPRVTPGAPRLAEMWHALRGNGPLLRLFAAFLPVTLLGGMSNGVAYLYIDSYLGLGPRLPVIMVLALVASVLGIPFWGAMAARFERHRVWATSLVIGGIACTIFALVSPGAAAFPAAVVLFPVIAFTLVSAVVVLTMTADIVDYGRRVTGADHAGIYGSLFAFVQKSVLGVSAAAGLAIAGAFGFDATAATQSNDGVLGIKLTFALLPAFGLFGAAALIWGYPLTRARLAQIQAEEHRETAGVGLS